MRSPTLWRFGFAALFFAAAALHAAESVSDAYYYDEATMRYFHLKNSGVGVAEVDVRFASSPGSDGRWVGSGQRKDKELVFARIVGEGEDRGTYFIADVGDSKVVVRYKPNQSKTEDAGILGTYHRVNDAKRLQLVRKEFAAANEHLVTSLKSALKSWDAKDKPALLLWKDQWPWMRQHWLEVNLASPQAGRETAPKGAPAKDAFKKETAAPVPDKDPEYWFKMAQVTAYGAGFVDTRPVAKTGLEWDGEYDDFTGGHVTARLEKNGRLRLAFNFTRGPGDSASGSIETSAPPENLSKSKEGYLTANFTYISTNVDPDADPEAVAKAKEAAKANPITIKLTKIGHYLRVEMEHAERVAGRGWFDGIYRGAPVPDQ